MAVWANSIGLDFRDTAASVTDPTNCTFVIDTTTYPTSKTIGGVTTNLGWTDSSTRFSFDAASADPRFAGFFFSLDNDGVLKVDLDEAGDHEIHLALGAVGSSFGDMVVEIYDDAALLDTISGATSANDNYIDTDEALHTSQANWLSNNTPRMYDFTSGILNLKLIWVGSPATPIAHAVISPHIVPGGVVAPKFTSMISRNRSF